jgi:hypothetical protein
MAVTADKPAPYAPIKSILEIIDRYRHRGLSSPIDADVLGRAGITDSLIPRTLQSLHTLDLIDEAGKPTATFEGIRLAPETEFKKRLEDWLKGAYADVFSFVDPTKDGEDRIRDAFRSYRPIAQQPRMVSLFQGLSAAAGITNTTPATPRATSRPTPTLAAKRVIPKPNPTSSPPGGTVTVTGVPAAVTALLASLPLDGRGWTKQRREKFMLTLGALLDFYFPVVSEDEEEQIAAE